MKKIIAILIASFSFSGLYAQEIITDRPDQTEASSVVPLKSLQIESGLLLQFNDNSLGKSRNIAAPNNLLRYGITKWFELRVVSQFESNAFNNIKSEGMSDLEIGTKIQLLRKSNINTEIALLSHLIVPTGTESLTNDSYGVISRFCISHVINESSSVGYNIGYNYRGGNKGDITYTLAYGLSVTDKVGLYLEPYGEITDLKIHEASLDAGVTYLLKPTIQLDFSFGLGINHKMNYLSTGISWLIVRK
ncbi:MAG: transporter [Flavobacteriales bacterium]